MLIDLWQNCLEILKKEISSQKYNMWIRPLQADVSGKNLRLFAPNRFVRDWITQHYLARFNELMNVDNLDFDNLIGVSVEIGTFDAIDAGLALSPAKPSLAPSEGSAISSSSSAAAATADDELLNDVNASSSVGSEFNGNTETAALGHPYRKESLPIQHNSNLNTKFTFDTFVEGKSNQLARAACWQVALNPGTAYNPLFIYGDVGLGKTHLMHAVGNKIIADRKGAKVLYLHSERFVADMVKALQTNTMEKFKAYYRTVDALLIDDIQFFAGKDRTQEEFFHTFNALLEGQQQIILTCDRYHKEIDGVEERLRSRLGWGLTVATEPPELETRVAILMKKAEQSQVELPYEVAFFIAKRIRSNVRELEGALKRVVANAQFMGQEITLEFTREALKDLISLQDKLVTIDNIQKTVAEYYKIKVSDLSSKRRNRSVARPRQMAMSLAKELTQHSLPEIGDAFGGRDHTTVLHACRTIKTLRSTTHDIEEDYSNLLRILTN